MDKPSKREGYLHLVEFKNNNGHQISLRMIPYKDLYGRECKMSVSWDNLVNRVVLGPNMITEMEQEVIKLRKKLKVALDR